VRERGPTVRLAQGVTAHRRLVLGALALITAFFAAQLPWLQLDRSADGVLLENDPEFARVAELAETFGLDEILIIAVHGDDVFAPETLEKIRRLTNAATRLDGVADVVSVTNVHDIRSQGDGLAVAPLVPRDLATASPTLAAARARAVETRIFARHLVSLDGRTATVNLFIETRPDDRFHRADLVAAVSEMAAEEQGPEELYLAGIPRTKVALSTQLQFDVAVLTPVTVVFLGVVLFLAFGTVRGVALPLLSVGTALVWTLGSMALAGRSISIVSNALPSLLLIVGTSYAMYLLGAYYEHVEAGKDGEAATRDMVEQVAGAVTVSGVTTAIGLFALTLNDVATVKDLGAFGAIGVLSALAVSLTFVPAVLVGFPAKPPRPWGPVSRWTPQLLGWIADFALRRPRVILVGALVALLGIGAGAWHLEVESDYLSYLPEDSEVVTSARRLHHQISGSVPVYLLLEADRPDGLLDPAVVASTRSLQRFAERHDRIDASLSFVDYIEQIHGELNPLQPDGTLPASAEVAAHDLGLYSLFSPADELWHHISEDRSRGVVLLRTDLAAAGPLTAAVDEILARSDLLFAGLPVEVSATGTMMLLNKTSDSISTGLLRGLVVAFVGIGTVLFLVLRSPPLVVAALLPNALPVALVFGLMGLLGLKLNTGTSVVGAIVFGIAVDDTVHFLMRFRRERGSGSGVVDALRAAILGVGRPMIFTSVALAAGFTVFLLSSFTPMVALGGLTTATVLAAILCDLLLLPALILLLLGEDGDLKQPSTAD